MILDCLAINAVSQILSKLFVGSYRQYKKKSAKIAFAQNSLWFIYCVYKSEIFGQ